MCFVTENCVSVSEYAENEEMREGLRRSDRIRSVTLDLLWGTDVFPGIPGIDTVSTETGNFIYDEVKKTVEKLIGVKEQM